MKNIMFSTTRQWNCGDEFILFGILNLMRSLLGEDFNPLIYNRNPSIRMTFDDYSIRHPVRSLKRYFCSSILECDNSFHKRCDWHGAIDAAFCAGTPEWIGKRQEDFYNVVRKENLPLYVLGAGCFPSVGYDNLPERDVIERAKVLTFRTKSLAESAKRKGLKSAKYIPCPALLSANKDQEKHFARDPDRDGVVIGLGFNIEACYTVPDIALSGGAYQFSINAFKDLIERFSSDHIRFVAICHYIDELPFARKFFSEYGIPVRYSYNSQDYFSIYQNIDLLISSRVHGCGICASMGIPSIGISHDHRGDTLQGFLSDIVSPADSLDDIRNKTANALASIVERSAHLIKHKKSVFEEYMNELQGKI